MILLDEPTAHLDDASAARAHAAIRDLATRKAVIAVTHRADLVEVADRHTHLAARVTPEARHDRAPTLPATVMPDLRTVRLTRPLVAAGLRAGSRSPAASP